METWFGGLLPQDLMAHLYQLILTADQFTLSMALMDPYYLQMMKEGYSDLMESHYQLMRVENLWVWMDLHYQQMMMEIWFGGLLQQDLMAHHFQQIQMADLFTLFMAPMDLHYLQMMKEGYLDLMESHYQLMRVVSLWEQMVPPCRQMIMEI
uniref:Uncharacterized protein n=1 Tax=Plectus sambesii TaxID=2011161 RepID=A0A914XKB3_9BILA